MTAAIASPMLATTTAPVTTGADERDKLAGVAKQFEAIFLRQMLASARKTNFGDTMFSGSQGLDTFRQMQDERFADIASDTGAFGLAKMIETHLAKFVTAQKTDGEKTDDATGSDQTDAATTNGKEAVTNVL